jgi:hypothetical protein
VLGLKISVPPSLAVYFTSASREAIKSTYAKDSNKKLNCKGTKSSSCGEKHKFNYIFQKELGILN